MPKANGTLGNCYAIFRDEVKMAICPSEHVANWIMEAMKQRMNNQTIPADAFRWKIEPWFIEGEF